MPTSDSLPDPPAGRGARSAARGRSAGYKLQALRDFTFGLSRARDFDESLRLALMVILGTFSIAKGVLFLEEDGEFRARVSRGLPPGIPPVERSRELLSFLRRTRQPVPVRRRSTARTLREAVAAVEATVPALCAETCCALSARKGVLGLLLLGPTLTGRGLSGRQRETLGVMVSFLSTNISNRNVLREISSLNDLLREQVRENRRLLEGMEEIYLDTIRALAAAIDAKDPYTRGHSERVAKISVSIARAMGLAEGEVRAIEVASLLHDVGKIATERVVLTKGSALTPTEMRELQKHPRTSYDILSEIRFPHPDVALLARHHHERVDGAGYPDGKRDREIPLGARIIAVADAFDAMVSDRPYRNRLPLVHALREIRSEMSRQFDATVGSAFFRLLRSELNGEKGVGGLPRLNGTAAARREALSFVDRSIRGLP